MRTFTLALSIALLFSGCGATDTNPSVSTKAATTVQSSQKSCTSQYSTLTAAINQMDSCETTSDCVAGSYLPLSCGVNLLNKTASLASATSLINTYSANCGQLIFNCPAIFPGTPLCQSGKCIVSH